MDTNRLLVNNVNEKDVCLLRLFNQCRLLLFVLLLLSLSVLFIYDVGTDITFKTAILEPGTIFVSQPSNESIQLFEKYDPGYFVKTTGCQMPAMTAMSPSIEKYFSKPDPIICRYGNSTQPLVQSNTTTLWVDLDALISFNIQDSQSVSCCYEELFRPQPNDSNDNDNRFSYSGNCKNFSDHETVSAEFVKVTCTYNGDKIYTDFHAFVPIKEEVEQRCRKSSKGQEPLSVLILGIDAVSRLNFHRTMGKTLNYLLKNMSAFEMIGYNKVADNTFPNLVPVLTGESLDELMKACWPTDEKYFDSCRFIWDDYKYSGYRTAFAEDASWMGAFNYQKKGFLNNPTDYYWRTFNYNAEKEIGSEKRMNAKLCVGSRLTYQTLLSYTEKFVYSMENRPYFGLFWETSMTHDYVNYPFLVDESYLTLLQNLYEKNSLNNTVLILLSDHGIRWGQFRSTYQGMMEERQPLVYFVFPDWFKERYTTAIKNIGKNMRKLTSPFDLHATIKDLLNHEYNLNENYLHTRQIQLEQSAIPRGISMFLPIPNNRTCAIAGILPHWCTCHESAPENINSTAVKDAAKFVVNNINVMISSYPQCANLSLNSILDASVGKSAEHLLSASPTPILDYTISIETIPGFGRFEATVRKIENSFNLTGGISRINLYKDQSRCVDVYNLKLYCFCGS